MFGFIEIGMACVLVGVLSGFVAGIYGMGGAVMVPLLALVLSRAGMAPGDALRSAIATALLATAVMAALGALAHWRRGTVHMGWLRVLGVGGALGALAGGMLGSFVRPVVLLVLVGGFQILASWMMLRPRLVAGETAEPQARKIEGVHGVLMGAACALTGVGGGVLFTPYMIMRKEALPRAVGTGLAISLAVTIFAAGGYSMGSALGFTPLGAKAFVWPAFGALALGSLVGVPLGVRAARVLPDGPMRFALSIGLGAMGIKMIAEGFAAFGVTLLPSFGM